MIKWLGTIASIIGAFLVASKIAFLGYVFFSFGSLFWLYIGIKQKDYSLITLNGVFFSANMLGLFNYV